MGYKKLLANNRERHGLNLVRRKPFIVNVEAGVYFAQLIGILPQFSGPRIAGIFIDGIKRNTLRLAESDCVIKERLIPILTAGIKDDL